MHALARRVQLPRSEPRRPERHSQLDQPVRPRVSVRSESVRQVPGWRRTPRAASASEKVALLNLAKCIRAHGVANFPDPTTSPPPAPPPGSHTGNAVGIDGVYRRSHLSHRRSSGQRPSAGSGFPDARRQTAIPASPIGQHTETTLTVMSATGYPRGRSSAFGRRASEQQSSHHSPMSRSVTTGDGSAKLSRLGGSMVPPGTSSSSGEHRSDAGGGELASCRPIRAHVMGWARYSSPRRNGRGADAYGRSAGRADCPLIDMSSSYDDYRQG